MFCENSAWNARALTWHVCIFEEKGQFLEKLLISKLELIK